jgi:hypothetical protein
MALLAPRARTTVAVHVVGATSQDSALGVMRAGEATRAGGHRGCRGLLELSAMGSRVPIDTHAANRIVGAATHGQPDEDGAGDREEQVEQLEDKARRGEHVRQGRREAGALLERALDDRDRRVAAARHMPGFTLRASASLVSTTKFLR